MFSFASLHMQPERTVTAGFLVTASSQWYKIRSNTRKFAKTINPIHGKLILFSLNLHLVNLLDKLNNTKFNKYMYIHACVNICVYKHICSFTTYF